MSKQRLSVTEHQALGKRLQRLQEELRAIGAIIGRAFPVGRGDRWARDSNRLLDHRSWLEAELIKATQAEGSDDGSVPKVYYRGQEPYRGSRE